MADEWDQFPDAEQPQAAAPQDAAGGDPWAQFPDDTASAQAAPAVAAEAPKPSIADRLLKGMDSKYNPLRFGMIGLPEAMANIATSAVAAPVSGVAGLIGAAAPGGETGAQKVESWGNALTYQPMSESGQTMTGVLTYPFRKLSEAGDAAGDVVNTEVPALPTTDRAPVSYSPGSGGWPMAGSKGNAAGATAANTAIQSLPALLLRGSPKARPSAAKPAAPPAPKPAPTPAEIAAANAQKAGYKLTPTQVGAKGGSIAEGLSGQAALERAIARENVTVTDNLAARSIGLEAGKPITPAAIAELKTKANKAYEAVAKTGERKTSDAYRQDIENVGDRTGSKSFAEDVNVDVARLKEIYGGKKSFNAQDAVNKIRQLRKEARQNMRSNNTPEQQAKGHAQRQIADALDAELGRHVSDLGKPELAASYEAARVQLAKINSVEQALQGTNVSARKLAQLQARGVPLSGELKLIADTYDSYGKVLQDASKIRGAGPFSVLDGFAGVGGFAIDPTLAAAALARPAARAFLKSDTYQRRLVGEGKGALRPPAGPNSLETAPAAKANALGQQAQQRRRAK